MKILVLNSGSSSIKYQLFKMPQRDVICSGMVERIGLADAEIHYKSAQNKIDEVSDIPNHKIGLEKIDYEYFFTIQSLIFSHNKKTIDNISKISTEKIGELLLNEKINFNAVVDLLKAQTNFVMGLRALTNLSVVELRSGKQEEKKKGEHINPNVHKMTELVGLYAEALSSLSEGGLKSDILKKLNYELNLLFTDHSQALMNLPDSKIMDNLGSPTSRDGFKRFNLIPEVKKYLYTPSGSLFNEIELANQIENEKNAIRNLAKFSKIVSDGIQAETERGLLNNNQIDELQKELYSVD